MLNYLFNKYPRSTILFVFSYSSLISSYTFSIYPEFNRKYLEKEQK